MPSPTLCTLCTGFLVDSRGVSWAGIAFSQRRARRGSSPTSSAASPLLRAIESWAVLNLWSTISLEALMEPTKLIAVSPSIAWLGTASLLLGQQADAADVKAPAAALIAKHCLSCHDTRAASGLDLTTRKGALRGGKSGPALVPGDPEASLLWSRVSAGEMPLGNPLPLQERKVFRDWIAAGAAWSEVIANAPPTVPADPDWWAFKPTQEPQPPSPDGLPDRWKSSPLDRFVYQRMIQHHLDPSPPANPHTLVRRASFDLTGLPPTPQEAQTFINDPAAAAYEKLIDRLLASPRYGERWGRHWLDVARFAESEGFERDRLREKAWPSDRLRIGRKPRPAGMPATGSSGATRRADSRAKRFGMRCSQLVAW